MEMGVLDWPPSLVPKNGLPGKMFSLVLTTDGN